MQWMLEFVELYVSFV